MRLLANVASVWHVTGKPREVSSVAKASRPIRSIVFLQMKSPARETRRGWKCLRCERTNSKHNSFYPKRTKKSMLFVGYPWIL